jgi:hypothetical protein
MEGRYQAIDHLETGPDLLALALAEGAGDPSSKDFGAHIIRIRRTCPWHPHLHGLDGGLVNLP